MTERLLQYIWQFQYFNNRNLICVDGEQLQVIHCGIYNTNQGPDFINARIQTGKTTWVGSIEIHIRSSDWYAHHHSTDNNYHNVILHVVWKNDAHAPLPFPTLELEPRVSVLLLGRYEELMQSPHFIPCQAHIAQVTDVVFQGWKERLLVERLQERSQTLEALLATNNQHWEECFWWLLAKNFGIKINADSFEQIAKSIPVNLLAKHKHQLQQVEALLMGQAALLDKTFDESYPNMLRKEYVFLQKKYGLKKAQAPLYFLRMRPANFPTLRLAQLAALVQQSRHLFSGIKDEESLVRIRSWFRVTANDYWHYHYMFDEKTAFRKKTLGEEMINNILVNTIIPVVYAYGYINNSTSYQEKALRWMEEISAEKNSITRGFQALGILCTTAFDSQALIQLKNRYCNYKKCLQCSVGNRLLKEGYNR